MSRYYAFTLNEYTEEQEQKLQDLAKDTKFMHLLYGREKAPTTGTKHLQGCFCLKKKSKLQAIKNYIGINELHLEPCKKNYQANLNYCKKSGDIWQFPLEFIKDDPPENRKTYAQAVELAKEGKFSEISAEKLLKYEHKFKKIFVENLECNNLYLTNEYGNFFPDFNLLMYGPTGTGKSYRIDELVFILNQFWNAYCNHRDITFKPLRMYRKSRNKWWDDYQGEEICIIEELEPNWCQLAARLLIKQDYEPIHRRLCVIKINNIYEEINWPRLDRLSLYYDTINRVRSNIAENCYKPIINDIENTSLECNLSEPPAELSDNSNLEPILLDTIEDENYETESEWPICKICGQNETYNSYEERCTECTNKGLVYRPDVEPAYKNNEYFDKLLESAYKTQDALKEQKKFNKVYHLNVVTDFFWDKKDELEELNLYKIIIKDFNLKIKNSKRKISSIQKELSKLRFKKSSLDEGYTFIDNMNCGPYEILKDYKEKANILSDIIIQIGNCNELIEKYDKDIESELGSILYYHSMINRYTIRYQNLLINSNKKLNEVYKKINTLDEIYLFIFSHFVHKEILMNFLFIYI
ncbi:hypothetical protein BCR32DRAFT_247260 [Anaeromyces robustus]|uniref:ATP-dependent helicase Rep n=1 Tax=Anaeromyces robustus TaxID=1754192 RepID=A0A1Y1WXK0_9FUNG|nr:hypothetical protein BCR32DRAFT_247260 [Anaeromyces robustus]|eukprot:ORX78299.1 hypothetical protein BCR32DRAFT_247260 [Anaeromyces robustus]